MGPPGRRVRFHPNVDPDISGLSDEVRKGPGHRGMVSFIGRIDVTATHYRAHRIKLGSALERPSSFILSDEGAHVLNRETLVGKCGFLANEGPFRQRPGEYEPSAIYGAC